MTNNNGATWAEERDNDPSLQPVEVFMTADENDGGLGRYEGNIYTMPRHAAEKFAAKGSAAIVDIAPVKTYRAKVDALGNQLQAAVDEIKGNKRLSNDGKREDIAALVSQYESAAAGIQEDYEREIASLKASEFEKANKFSEFDSKLNPYEIRTQAGLLTASLSMSPSFNESVDAIKSKIDTMDSAVARELLAQFTDIKRDLDGKKKGKDLIARNKETQAIRGLYEALERASLSPAQAKSRNKHKMIEAIEMQKGDIRTNFKQQTRAINFSLRELR
ncbi:hypothetical protein KD050_18895 [Psychrobacillus sp. INOP01]|uniref:hypothetical protein n=1 Tax=Psychrobacillus sp. INOP01 TaxID=2829187 RepID=UPI001BAA6242|nr:hypothetical protein [Psychrobacillus sp. INOP01]QUG41318.1 hypothetical protein KD050_18895 [Psychrobacillus sp. INOP01]